MHPVVLRPVNLDEDFCALYACMQNPETQYLFMRNYRLSTPDAFRRWLQERLCTNFHDFFMLQHGDRTIGFSFSYDFCIADGHCKLTLCLFPAYAGSGLGALAGLAVLKYLFREYPLRQVFSEVYGYNAPCLSLHDERHGVFHKVAEIPDYRYYDGRYWPLEIFTVEREVLQKAVGRYLPQ